MAKDSGDLHLREFFLGDGYPSKEADTYQQPLGTIKLLRGWGFLLLWICFLELGTWSGHDRCQEFQDR